MWDQGPSFYRFVLLSPRFFKKKAKGMLLSPLCYLLLNHLTKFNRIWCVSYSHEWGPQRQFLLPRPLVAWWGLKRSKSFNSRGTKVEKMLTLAPERYTAGFCMVAKVILLCIWNHCIAASIDLHKARAINFLRKPSKNMSKYKFSKCYIFLSKVFKIEKYWVCSGVDHRSSGGHLRILLIDF